MTLEIKFSSVKSCIEPVVVLCWGQRGTGPPNLAQAPKFLDTVVLLLVELIGSIVNFA